MSLLRIYERLFHAYGPQHWWPGDSQFEIIIGAILTQSTAWTNVEKALNNLKNAGVLSPEALRDIPEADLAQLIQPSGYFNAKAKKVKAFMAYLCGAHHGDLDSLLHGNPACLRDELLSIYGIGPETADDIVLYAAELPSFVIDAYTRRVLERLGLDQGATTYDEYQQVFHTSLPANVPLFNEYHGLLVKHGKDVCRKRPLCKGCCLLDVCPVGLKTVAAD